MMSRVREEKSICDDAVPVTLRELSNTLKKTSERILKQTKTQFDCEDDDWKWPRVLKQAATNGWPLPILNFGCELLMLYWGALSELICQFHVGMTASRHTAPPPSVTNRQISATLLPAKNEGPLFLHRHDLIWCGAVVA